MLQPTTTDITWNQNLHMSYVVMIHGGNIHSLFSVDGFHCTEGRYVTMTLANIMDFAGFPWICLA